MPKKNNKEYISRLMAVQACYQMFHNKKPPGELVQEYLEEGLRIDGKGEELANPNGGLFKKIVLNLHDCREEIEAITNGHTLHLKEVEPLLRSILLCGVCELLEHTKTDSALIVNDYLNVTHEYYPKAQVSLVNGILDAVAKNLR